MTVVAHLARHEQRRRHGVSTVSFFVGPPGLGARSWRKGAASQNRAIAECHEMSEREVARATESRRASRLRIGYLPESKTTGISGVAAAASSSDETGPGEGLGASPPHDSEPARMVKDRETSVFSLVDLICHSPLSAVTRLISKSASSGNRGPDPSSRHSWNPP